MALLEGFRDWRNSKRNRLRSRPIQGITPPPPAAIQQSPPPPPRQSKGTNDSGKKVSQQVNRPLVMEEPVATPIRVSQSVSANSSLPYAQNPYPADVGLDPSAYYTRSGGNIKFTGKYPQNFLTFKEVSVGNITAVSGIDINFIVKFSDGTLYTSPRFKGILEAEQSSRNPYKNRNTVPTIIIDSNFLSTYAGKNKFKTPEDYAEVSVTKTIKSKNDILQHINWLVGPGETLREAKEIGNWSVQKTAQLGMDHQGALDALEGQERIQSAEEPNNQVEVTTASDPVPTTPIETDTNEGNDTSSTPTGDTTPPPPPKPTPDPPPPPPPPPPPRPPYDVPRPMTGGQKIICGELYRQGYLSEKIWKADQVFGKKVFKTHPRLMLGYTFWARNVVKYMKNNPHRTERLYRFFKPWTEHMAYRMGVVEKDNLLGNITHKVGYVISLVVYNYHQIKWGRFKFSYGK